MRNRPPCPVAPVPGYFVGLLGGGPVLVLPLPREPSWRLPPFAPPALAAPGLEARHGGSVQAEVPGRLRVACQCRLSNRPIPATAGGWQPGGPVGADGRAPVHHAGRGCAARGWAPASGTRPAARAQPTLRLKVAGLAGQPASNVHVVLMNTDNAGLDPAPLSVNGTARVTVPAGDYSLFALFVDFDAKGNAVAFHCVVRDDFRVTAAGATVTVAERSASSPISVATPRPAGGEELETVFFRGSKAGGGTGTGLILTPPYLLPTYISPAARAQGR